MKGDTLLAVSLTEQMPILNAAVQIAFVMVMAGVILAMIRLIKGPSLPDRVVALDTMTVLVVAFSGLFAIDTGVAAFLDVAVVLALIGFLATVALARFVERRTSRPDAQRLHRAGEDSEDGGLWRCSYSCARSGYRDFSAHNRACRRPYDRPRCVQVGRSALAANQDRPRSADEAGGAGRLTEGAIRPAACPSRYPAMPGTPCGGAPLHRPHRPRPRPHLPEGGLSGCGGTAGYGP